MKSMNKHLRILVDSLVAIKQMSIATRVLAIHGRISDTSLLSHFSHLYVFIFIQNYRHRCN